MRTALRIVLNDPPLPRPPGVEAFFLAFPSPLELWPFSLGVLHRVEAAVACAQPDPAALTA